MTEHTDPTDGQAVVFITGAARRIGAEIARTFHQAGYRVVIHCHRSRTDADALALQLNEIRAGSTSVVSADLTDEHALSGLGDAVLSCHQRLDVLVNNASSFYPTPLPSLTQVQWLDLMNSNARAGLFLAQQLAPALSTTAGSIINLTDINVSRGMAEFSAYTMAKAALGAMTRSLARELAPRVRVNAVSPGAILWPEHTQASAAQDAEQAGIISGIPLGRLGTPADIARTVLFLARDATYITGQNIRVDGGRALG
ncbi:pteridine reductase [Pseudohongiella sp.]|uniref:Pteridine reductase n=1 Tax=marine sediment metagenome TaxID=412755 RepID=A0A0F9W3L5_9ZZZZ|nr:pteridine reductase [Pseudohongiella sp.]HDZ10009.1 pteridine reductase [Pseudohongiella sp.]HEA63905.1 pteridine reductase [Pseudohongiella sp.]